MSAYIETSTSAFWRKRHREEDSSPSHMARKRLRYYYRLESESSKASEDDTESVYSIQGRETDVVKDSSDTDTNSVASEYEVESFSENELWEVNSNTSSGSENITLGHLVAAAEAMYDSSLEKWVTDCEESDNSSLDDSSISRSDFSTCAQCKSLNVNPLYRYCEKCYQSCRQCNMQKTYKGFPLCISCHKDRKKFFPPRPRGNKKSRKSKQNAEPAVKLETLRSALNGLSQDSGIGSSQEMPLSCPKSVPIAIPVDHLKTGTSNMSSSSLTTQSITKHQPPKSSSNFSNGEIMSITKNSRKRYISESSLSDFEIKKPKLEEKPSGRDTDVVVVGGSSQEEKQDITKNEDSVSSTVTSSTESVGKSQSASQSNQIEKENSELCIMCKNAPKDSIFLHTNIAHQCCCYKCAKRTLYTYKRCPICNRSVNKIVKIYTS